MNVLNVEKEWPLLHMLVDTIAPNATFGWGDPKLEHINIKMGWACAFVIFTMLIVFVGNIR